MYALQQITYLCKKTPPLLLTLSPTIDTIDNFITEIGHEIRKPEEEFFDTTMEIMNFVRRKQSQDMPIKK